MYVLKVLLSTPNRQFRDFMELKSSDINCIISEIARLEAIELFKKLDGACMRSFIRHMSRFLSLSFLSSRAKLLWQKEQQDNEGI